MTLGCLKVVLASQDPAWVELQAFPGPRDLEAVPLVPLEPGAFLALQEAFHGDHGALGASCLVGPLGPRKPVLPVVVAPAFDSVAPPPEMRDFISI